jgi:hypothetical protein
VTKRSSKIDQADPYVCPVYVVLGIFVRETEIENEKTASHVL